MQTAKHRAPGALGRQSRGSQGRGHCGSGGTWLTPGQGRPLARLPRHHSLETESGRNTQVLGWSLRYVYGHVGLCVCIHIDTYIYIHACLYVCCVCVYIHIYT